MMNMMMRLFLPITMKALEAVLTGCFLFRDVPSSAALPIIRPALGRQHSISDRAKVAMQGYLNHFLSNIDIVNSREVCKFLEVSKLSFSPECGPKLKEDYVMVKHLPKIPNNDDYRRCCACPWFSCCNDNWQKVWAVLKPGFFSLLKDPFDTKPLDVIVFDVLPASDGNGEGRVSLAKEIKEPNPLRHSFKVSGVLLLLLFVENSTCRFFVMPIGFLFFTLFFLVD
ncbi:hypothetical protein CsSME_00021250 [Camellia sinensis var. sinensis]